MAPSVITSLSSALTTAYTFLSFFSRNTPPNPPSSLLRPLTLSPDNTFTLALFSDLHYGEAESLSWGPEQDLNSSRVTSSILSSEPSTNLIVLLGDLITGENTFAHNSSAYVHAVVAPLVKAGVPWASVYGNHDSSSTLRREDMLDVERGYEGSYTSTTEGLEGTTNYYLLVWPNAQQRAEGTPVTVLWFLDSRGYVRHENPTKRGDDEEDIPNWVSPNTLKWFLQEARRLRCRYGRVLPSLMFVHIPPTAFLTAQRKGIDASLFPGVNDEVAVAIQGTGTEDGAFMDALRQEGEVGGLHSVYVGHDHGNAWCALWPQENKRDTTHSGGPLLCFGRHTGYGGYGTWDRGARMVQLRFADEKGGGSSEMAVETWVRMESGEVITKVTLSETYGRDVYPRER